MNQPSSKKPLLLLLFIPVIIAALLVWELNGAGNLPAKVTLHSSVTGDREYLSAEDLQFFSQMLDEAEPIDEAIRPMEDYHRLMLTVREMTEEKRYTLLLSGTPTDCLFTDADSVLYRIPTEHARALLLKSELEYVNSHYDFPEASITNGTSTLSLDDSQSILWHYQAADGEFRQRSQESAASEVFVLPQDQSPSLCFSHPPHWTNVIISKGEKELYNDTAENLSSFTYTGDGDLQMKIHAKWNCENNAGYYGESKISLTLRCDAAPGFAISEESCYPGDPVFLLAKNCLNSELTLTSTLSGADKAQVIDYYGEKVILLPVPLSAKPGKYEITVSGEGRKESFSLTVANKEFSNEALTGLDIAKAKSAFEQEQARLEALMATPSPEQLWNGNFSEPVGGEDAWISCRFGAYVTIDGANTGLRHNGLDYVHQPQSFVAAANDGTVIFAGQLPYSGNTVVIDHGLGIYSIYGSLESLGVSEGMKIYKSQTVGTLGNSGFAGGSCLHFEIRMAGVSVNPFSFLGKEPDFFDLRLAAN